MIASIEQPEVDMTIDEARDVIGELLHEMSLLGANDHEYPDVQVILDDLRIGRCSPNQAVERARAIRDNKMEYR